MIESACTAPTGDDRQPETGGKNQLDDGHLQLPLDTGRRRIRMQARRRRLRRLQHGHDHLRRAARRGRPLLQRQSAQRQRDRRPGDLRLDRGHDRPDGDDRHPPGRPELRRQPRLHLPLGGGLDLPVQPRRIRPAGKLRDLHLDRQNLPDDHPGREIHLRGQSQRPGRPTRARRRPSAGTSTPRSSDTTPPETTIKTNPHGPDAKARRRPSPTNRTSPARPSNASSTPAPSPPARRPAITYTEPRRRAPHLPGRRDRRQQQQRPDPRRLQLHDRLRRRRPHEEPPPRRTAARRTAEPPDTKITSKPAAKTHDRTPTIKFKADGRRRHLPVQGRRPGLQVVPLAADDEDPLLRQAHGQGPGDRRRRSPTRRPRRSRSRS